MSKALLPVALALIWLSASCCHAQSFSAMLTGEEQVPAVNTSTSGYFYASMNETTGMWEWALELMDPEGVTMAHIHQGAVGINGPVVYQLLPLDPAEPMLEDPLTEMGTVVVEDTIMPMWLTGPLEGMGISDLEEEVKAGNTYVNVHSVAYPGGVVRGQLEYME